MIKIGWCLDPSVKIIAVLNTPFKKFSYSVLVNGVYDKVEANYLKGVIKEQIFRQVVNYYWGKNSFRDLEEVKKYVGYKFDSGEFEIDINAEQGYPKGV